MKKKKLTEIPSGPIVENIGLSPSMQLTKTNKNMLTGLNVPSVYKIFHHKHADVGLKVYSLLISLTKGVTMSANTYIVNISTLDSGGHFLGYTRLARTRNEPVYNPKLYYRRSGGDFELYVESTSRIRVVFLLDEIPIISELQASLPNGAVLMD